MTTAFRLRQVWTVARLEARRAFFSKRAVWVYLLALFPSVIFIGHGIDIKLKRDRWAARGLTPAAVIDSFQRGETDREVRARAGKPLYDRRWSGRHEDSSEYRNITYFDGTRKVDLSFKNGVLDSKNTQPLSNFEEDRGVFAAVFELYYLRLAVFFGCLGIFMNLFRGEMHDKTLHFWLLAPMRREVLLGGKYLAGLLAASVIFTAGALLCYAAMLWPQPASGVQAFWREQGLSHALQYSAAAALACVGYGSVFLASGLLLRNPIVPAAVLLLWEGIIAFLPSMLQKISVLYYVQALCPVPVPVDPHTPALVRLFLSPAEPPSIAIAVLGLLVVTALVLWCASRAVRKLQINYGAE
jgi:ABC-type transport system involved in multi-copper enzyme maturation permease subunit